MSQRAPEGNERELFVSGDIGAIPAGELRPMCTGIVQWLMAIVLFKIFKTRVPVNFAAENRRLVRIEAEQVPKRIMKHFDSLRPTLEDMGFHLNYYATVPAIGPIAIAVMTMSPRGMAKAHFFCTQAVIKQDGQITEDGHRGFVSSCSGDDALMTISPAKLPRPRSGVKRKVLPTQEPRELFAEHRKRMRDHAVKEVSAEELITIARRQNLLECEDLLARKVIRPATQGEIAKIRASR